MSIINTTSKLGLPSITLLRNQHGKIQVTSKGVSNKPRQQRNTGIWPIEAACKESTTQIRFSCGKASSLCLANGLGGRSCQSYGFFILHVEGYKSGNSLRRSPFGPAVETRSARNTEPHRETPKAKGAIRAQELTTKYGPASPSAGGWECGSCAPQTHIVKRRRLSGYAKRLSSWRPFS